MMLRFVVLFFFAAALATPPLGKSREAIEAFRDYLESARTPNGVRLEDRMSQNPQSKAWENSGRYQGDILLDEEQVQSMVQDFATGRNAYTWPNTKWPQNTIVYEIAAGHFSNAAQNAIIAGIRDIERQTCIRFRQRQWQDNNYVRVTSFSDGCYANVGYWGSRGVHTLNLAWPSCSLHTTIVHEWLHIIGFLHMQSTHNRDDYVRILWENILPGMEHNFDKYASNLVSNLGLPYDYSSTMHYGGYGFSINGRPTMVALRDNTGVMGQQQWISALDWQRANRHYNCPGSWSRDTGADRVAVADEIPNEFADNVVVAGEFVPEVADNVAVVDEIVADVAGNVAVAEILNEVAEQPEFLN